MYFRINSAKLWLTVVLIPESGGSLVISLWIKRLWVRIPSTALTSVLRSLSRFSQLIRKRIAEFRWRGSSTSSWVLKYGSVRLCPSLKWLWSVIALALRSKTIPDVLDTSSNKHGHRMCPLTCTTHACDYIDYCMPCKAAKITVITWARIRRVLTLQEVILIIAQCPHPYLTVSTEQTKDEQPPENISMDFTFGLMGRI